MSSKNIKRFSIEEELSKVQMRGILGATIVGEAMMEQKSVRTVPAATPHNSRMGIMKQHTVIVKWK
ncbi:hypothetical protein HF324_16915 [Chitinophaga oryzae]|uniref:Uncharacterized protein n=1 Tax=Chitinophaga oryzae TaxID=2725414 RepID=A0ABX6LH55_9BACT|nr:hypothetical protein [Chitinophaga oryzae]QJB39448.1 hypothetical protein HF324_16915 [Chitinophaga oryzae]